MNKTEVYAELEALGTSYSGRETLPELRFKLAEARKEKGGGMTSQEKRREIDPMYGMQRLKVAALVLKCHELSLPATSKESKGALLSRLRMYYEGGAEKPFDADAPLTWSRHAGKTPKELALNEPDFIDWCLVAAREQKVTS